MPGSDYKPEAPKFLDSLNYLSLDLSGRLAMAEARIVKLESALVRVATTVWDQENNPRVYAREALNP